jgi:hypothetical protein
MSIQTGFDAAFDAYMTDNALRIEEYRLEARDAIVRMHQQVAGTPARALYQQMLENRAAGITRLKAHRAAIAKLMVDIMSAQLGRVVP